ncbi:type VII secretion target [Kitasatospora camelliae]|uniref:Type VII secretion target n=1 Tax=Kitasatospora camelliae TaxID=3156397 RepID=A0AAU8JWZ6_9ACTN
MTAGFRVHPTGLADAGQHARSTAERLRADAAAVAGPGDAAVAALPGWRTAAALHDCAEAWRVLLLRLVEELDGLGADLDRTAANYREAEDEAHHTLRSAG